MKYVLAAVLSWVLLLGACASHAQSAVAPASPPRHCEIQYSAWCVDQGVFEITSRLAEDSVHDRIWILRGEFVPKSRLIVLEPNGCRSGHSDKLSLVNYESEVQWEGEKWERMRARLKSDGSCDLDVLIPASDGDPMEWAFSTGLMLVKSCVDEKCSGPSLADLKPQVEGRRQSK